MDRKPITAIRTGRVDDRALLINLYDERLLPEYERAILDDHRARLGNKTDAGYPTS